MPQTVPVTSADIAKYLADAAKRLPFSVSEIQTITEVESGNNNYSFFLNRADGTRFFLRKAAPYNRRSVLKGKPVSVDPKRIETEVAMLTLLNKLWGRQFVPEIIFYDQGQQILIESDISQGMQQLSKEFAQRRIYPQHGKTCGRLFATLHAKTFNDKKEFSRSLSFKKTFLDVLVDDFWGRGLRAHVDPQLVEQWLAEVRETPQAVVWSDAVYKNIFVNHSQICFIDFDQACTYDPAFDNGLLLAHWAWMFLLTSTKKDAERFISDFIKNYCRIIQAASVMSSAQLEALLERTRRWVGYYLVSRTDGASGSYFAQWPNWEAEIRHLGIDLFLQRVSSPAAAWLTNTIRLV